MSLRLGMRQGERLLINGANVLFKESASILLENQARFVFGHQVLMPEEVETSLDRLYLAIQGAYVDGQDPAAIASTALDAMEDHPELVQEIAACAGLAEGGGYHRALEALRLLRQEQSVGEQK